MAQKKGFTEAWQEQYWHSQHGMATKGRRGLGFGNKNKQNGNTFVRGTKRSFSEVIGGEHDVQTNKSTVFVNSEPPKKKMKQKKAGNGPGQAELLAHVYHYLDKAGFNDVASLLKKSSHLSDIDTQAAQSQGMQLGLVHTFLPKDIVPANTSSEDSSESASSSSESSNNSSSASSSSSESDSSESSSSSGSSSESSSDSDSSSESSSEQQESSSEKSASDKNSSSQSSDSSSDSDSDSDSGSSDSSSADSSSDSSSDSDSDNESSDSDSESSSSSDSDSDNDSSSDSESSSSSDSD